jgi:hypothetical protein
MGLQLLLLLLSLLLLLLLLLELPVLVLRMVEVMMLMVQVLAVMAPRTREIITELSTLESDGSKGSAPGPFNLIIAPGQRACLRCRSKELMPVVSF